MPGQRKSLTGTVVSGKMDKTVVVTVQTTTRHSLYHKIMKRTKRYLVHDDRLEAKPGDTVRIVETRPLSRHKRWRVLEIIQRGEVPDIEAREIDAEYITLQREHEAPPPPKAVVEGEESPAETSGEAPSTLSETAAQDDEAEERDEP
jgi:small subunit ribosomal protein S17